LQAGNGLPVLVHHVRVIELEESLDILVAPCFEPRCVVGIQVHVLPSRLWRASCTRRAAPATRRTVSGPRTSRLHTRPARARAADRGSPAPSRRSARTAAAMPWDTAVRRARTPWPVHPRAVPPASAPFVLRSPPGFRRSLQQRPKRAHRG